MKIQHCFNCGEECGVFRAVPGDLVTCGKRECEREAANEERQQESDAFEAAREDHFDRYR